MPTASGVPLQILPRAINGVRIIGIDVPGFGVPTHAEAKDWALEIEAAKLDAHAPELGGPTQATLARMLARYAELFTAGKRGAIQELNRIGHYLQAAGLPLLRLGMDAEGKPRFVRLKRD